MKAIARGVAFAVAGAVAAVAAAADAGFGFKFEADHADCLYKVGEECVLTVTVTNGAGAAVDSGSCRVEIDNYGGTTYQVISKVDFSQGNPFVLRVAPPKPGFARFRFSGTDAHGDYFGCQWGVGFDPHLIRPGSERPADFDAFWENAVANFAATVPTAAQMVKNEAESTGTHDCYELTFATVPEGRKIRGQLSIPKGEGRYPITMNVPGAGSGTWGWTRPEGRCYLTLNVVDYPRRPNGDAAELYAEQNRRWCAKSGLTNDVYYFVGDLSKGREDYFYYGAILGINRAVDWVAALDKVDALDFRYEGQSQGGAFGIILSALNGHITRAQIGEPALTDLSGELLDGRQSGWPQPIYRTQKFPTLNENVKRIVPYYDCAHFVPRITIPTRWNVGFVDELCPPAAVWAGYNCLRTYDKMMHNFPGLGHGAPAALYRSAVVTTEASWDIAVPLPKNAPWIDAKIADYPEGPLTHRTVESVRGWGNWVGTNFTDIAQVVPAGTLEIETEEFLRYRGTQPTDLSKKVKNVQICTSVARFPSYAGAIDDLEVPDDSKAALTICNGSFYGLAAKGDANGWVLLGSAGAYADAEVSVKIVVENYAEGKAAVRYLVGNTPETVAQVGDVQRINAESVISGVSFGGCGALSCLEGAVRRKVRGLMVVVNGN